MTRIETNTEELELFIEAARTTGECLAVIHDNLGDPVALTVRDSNARRRSHRRVRNNGEVSVEPIVANVVKE